MIEDIDADITHTGPDTITGSPLFAFAKDGNNTPFWYLWDSNPLMKEIFG